MLATWLVILLAVIAWLAGPVTVVGLIAALIVATFVVAAFNSSPRPAETRLDAAGRLRLWAGEIGIAWVTVLFFIPLEHWLMPRSIRGARPGCVPVLLIHGYVNNAGALFLLWRTLKAAGHGVHTLNLEPVYADIDDYAASIEAALVRVQESEGGRPVALVCHSMGGLAARAYLRGHGGSRVAGVITLGSPHAGTVLAKTALGENGRQMRPGSAWLEVLAWDEGGRWPCPFVSVYSRDDNIVAPQLSAHLDGARNLPLAGIGHISLPMTASVAGLVVGELAAFEGRRNAQEPAT